MAADDYHPYLKAVLPDYDDTGRPLPPGVPRNVDTNGKVISIPHRFTTQAYHDEALKLVIAEANKVAVELKLPEKLPITMSNLVEYHIGPFEFNFSHRSVGFVSTKNYCYYVAKGNCFSSIVDMQEERKCQNYPDQGYVWPVRKMDTNAAYQLATQWLAAVHMDVARLNRDCTVSVTVDTAYTVAPAGKFVPIYFVAWIPSDGVGDEAAVRLFAPTKTLLDLTVRDRRYILRTPLVFTNLAALFPGVAPIHTNYPVTPIEMPEPSPR